MAAGICPGGEAAFNGSSTQGVGVSNECLYRCLGSSHRTHDFSDFILGRAFQFEIHVAGSHLADGIDDLADRAGQAARDEGGEQQGEENGCSGQREHQSPRRLCLFNGGGAIFRSEFSEILDELIDRCNIGILLAADLGQHEFGSIVASASLDHFNEFFLGWYVGGAGVDQLLQHGAAFGRIEGCAHLVDALTNDLAGSDEPGELLLDFFRCLDQQGVAHGARDDVERINDIVGCSQLGQAVIHHQFDVVTQRLEAHHAENSNDDQQDQCDGKTQCKLGSDF